jgi:AcrR family transcriptional regulator
MIGTKSLKGSAMGIKQRRERERQEIRQSILSAARQIAIEEGWQAVTTRKVAERIEYSQPTIYEYFDNKEAILLALLHNGFESVLAAMQVAKAQVQPPEEQLLAMSRAYWNFAFACPELYQVMYGLGGVSFTHADTPASARAIFALLRETVQPWMDEHNIALDEPDAPVDAIWGAVHGLITLTLAGRVAQGEPRARRIMERTVITLLRSWQTNS